MSWWNGITPASAGIIVALHHFVCVSGDHPRECGDNSINEEKYSAQYGITPASAGIIRAEFLQNAGHRDHPRECGDNYSSVSVFLSDGGSPPRVRG